MRLVKKKVFIDYYKNDKFGENVTIVEYPKYKNNNTKLYRNKIIKRFSSINITIPKKYVMIKNEKRKSKIIAKLIKIIIHNRNSLINIFAEDTLKTTFISKFPKIYYNGSIFIELIESSIIYGYAMIEYVTNSFIENKYYKKYDTEII